ncbi:ribosome maturation factor RimM [Sessilibacter sp. MAH2]
MSGLVPVGRIAGAFGIKGWVKILSDTEPRENIFQYTPWWLKTRHGVKVFECDEFQNHGKGLIAHIKGVDDRDAAELLAGVEIAIDREQLSPLEDGEYYWSQLMGLRVITHVNAEAGDADSGSLQSVDLGVVKKLIETGSNDVLVVMPDAQSFDDRERLLPYLPGQFILEINLDAGTILVDWDPDF